MTASERSVVISTTAASCVVFFCAGCAPVGKIDAAAPSPEAARSVFGDVWPATLDDGKIRIVSLGPDMEPGQSCSVDGSWCVSPEKENGDDDRIIPVVRASTDVEESSPVTQDLRGDYMYAAMPRLVILADGGFLAGVQTRASTAYSGGGGSATELRVFRLNGDGSPTKEPLLTLPVQGYKMIRACFDDADFKKLRGACHDEYEFAARINVDGVENGMPVFTYVTEAWNFPRGASLLTDSTERPRLKRSDLVRAPEAVCTFARRFRFNPLTKQYEPDAPLPDCSAYTEL